jgi:hypothetical protein
MAIVHVIYKVLPRNRIKMFWYLMGHVENQEVIVYEVKLVGASMGIIPGA